MYGTIVFGLGEVWDSRITLRGLRYIYHYRTRQYEFYYTIINFVTFIQSSILSSFQHVLTVHQDVLVYEDIVDLQNGLTATVPKHVICVQKVSLSYDDIMLRLLGIKHYCS